MATGALTLLIATGRKAKPILPAIRGGRYLGFESGYFILPYSGFGGLEINVPDSNFDAKIGQLSEKKKKNTN